MEQLYTLVEDRTDRRYLHDFEDERINFCCRGTENDCFEWILKNTNYSFFLATTEGGYKLLKYK